MFYKDHKLSQGLILFQSGSTKLCGAFFRNNSASCGPETALQSFFKNLEVTWKEVVGDL